MPARNARRAPKPPTYTDRLLAELNCIQNEYNKILAASAIVNVDPNRHTDGMAFIGFVEWDWVSSDLGLESARMAVLRRLRDWDPRFRLLFPHPTPTVAERLDEHLSRLERWLVREPEYDGSTKLSGVEVSSGSSGGGGAGA
jgi:hypothetical protein